MSKLVEIKVSLDLENAAHLALFQSLALAFAGDKIVAASNDAATAPVASIESAKTEEPERPASKSASPKSAKKTPPKKEPEPEPDPEPEAADLGMDLGDDEKAELTPADIREMLMGKYKTLKGSDPSAANALKNTVQSIISKAGFAKLDDVTDADTLSEMADAIEEA